MAYEFPFIDRLENLPRNLIFNPNLTGGKSALVLSPGLEKLADTGTLEVAGTVAEIRGMANMNDTVYIVAVDKLFKMNSSNTLTEITTSTTRLLTKTGAVTMEYNDASAARQLVICDGTYSYSYSETKNVLTKLSGDTHNFPGGESVAYLNGRWLFNLPDTNRFTWSSLNDSLTYDSTDYIGVSEPAGDILRLFTFNDQLVVFKKNGIIFYDNFISGGNPYTHRNGADMTVGLKGRNAVTEINSTIYWLGDDLNVYRANGYNPVVVSHYQLSTKFESYTVTDDAIAFGYIIDGLPYVVFTFPTEGKTWIYDPATKHWSERTSYRDDAFYDGIFRGNCYVKFGERHLIGDYRNGVVYEMKDTIYEDNGQPIKWKNICPAWDNNREFMNISELEVVCTQGTATLSGDGSAPTIILRYSKDNGNTWSMELWRALGETGEYGNRLRWLRLGSARKWYVELSGNAPIKWIITDVYVHPPERR